MNITLRDNQIQVVNKLYAAYKGGAHAPLLCFPTGGGKTVVFSYMAERFARHNRRVYTLVHRAELLRQSSEKLDMFGVKHGCVAPNHTVTGDIVQVASVQTLVRRLDRFPAPDLIIIDEAHHAMAGTWSKILNHWPNAHLLGVTATPIRMDGKGLGVSAGGFFDVLVEGPNTAELIQQNYLAEPCLYAPPTDIDMSGLQVRAGDYQKEELAKRVDKPKITGCAIEHYSKICPGVPAICFCVSIGHAEHVATEFKAAGWVAESIDGTMSDQERKHKIKALGEGKIHVLTSCDIISEGTDIPIVGAAILLRPTKSLGLYLQQVGRALRIYPGKTKAFILDHVGNCYRHGMPDDVRSWSLEGYKSNARGEASQGGLKIKQCPKCFAVYRQGVVACPQCGHIPQTNGREVKQVDGELVEYKGGQKKKWPKIEHDHGELGHLINFAKSIGLSGDFAHRVMLSREARKGAFNR